MKKLSMMVIGVILAMFLFAGMSFAQWTPVFTNQVTVVWNASTTLVTGDPLPAEDSVAYEIVIKQIPDGIEQVLGRTAELTYTVTVPAEGEWAVGVIAVRIKADGSENLSETNWSTEDGASTPNPFSVIYSIPLSPVENLRPQ